MKAVCPDLIEFAYVPTTSLHSEESDPKRRRTDDDLYDLPGQAAPQYTLLFEFTDRSVETSKATGKRVLNVKRGASQKETIRVIGRRNDMFERAMNTMLCACEEAVRFFAYPEHRSVGSGDGGSTKVCAGTPRRSSAGPRATDAAGATRCMGTRSCIQAERRTNPG